MCVLRLSRLIVLGIALWSATAEAATYYVSTSGNDANNGTSTNTPFRTIGKAASVVNAGDVVNVRGGTYSESVFVTRGGTLGNPVTFQNYQSEVVTLLGPSASNPGITITVPNVTIDGLRVTGFTEGGIALQGMSNSSSYTTIKNCQGYGNSAGGNAAGIRVIDQYLGTLEIANCLFHDNVGGGDQGNNTGITIFMDQMTSGTSFIWVHNNEVYNEGTGIKYKHAAPATANATATFELNLVHDMIFNGYGCLNSEQQNTIIRYNICYNTPIYNPGIDVGPITALGNCSGCQVHHNTVYNAASGLTVVTGTVNTSVHDNIWYTNAFDGASTNGAGLVLQDVLSSSILTASADFFAGGAINRALVSGWNIFPVFLSFAGLPAGLETSAKSGNPLFVNPTGSPPDFHLQAGSPARGAGTSGSNMGAYATGTEVIGPNGLGGGGGGPLPSPPGNLRVQ